MSGLGQFFIPSVHEETIICPGCGKIQIAIVKETLPIWTYSHTCDCGEEIDEDNWVPYELKSNNHRKTVS